MATKAKTGSKLKLTEGQGRKVKAPVSKSKLSRSTIGAPAQLNQSSRKGKKAWRKNVDITDVEAGLEEIRSEERVLGTAAHKTTNDDLFILDTDGDSKIRNTLPKLSLKNLTSTKILNQRSAVPAVISRLKPAAPTTKKRKLLLTKEEKDRLLRIAKRPRKGPFNSILDPSEYAAGSGTVELSQAVKESGSFDPWRPTDISAKELKDGMEHVQKKIVKPPSLKRMKSQIEVPAVLAPHQGTSYNPLADAHQELILKAASVEEKRLRDAEKTAEVKARIDQTSKVAEEEIGTVLGMAIQPLDEEGDDSEEVDTGRTFKAVKPKTKSQRNKAARVLAEKRALAEKAERKRSLVAINSAKAIRKSNAKALIEQEAKRQAKYQAQLQKLKTEGLAGAKLGKHKVPERDVEVQLGEDLTETLRGLKPEGSLFRDRFQSLQQRALIEPRVPVLPKKRRTRMIEYEKHPWKRFE